MSLGGRALAGEPLLERFSGIFLCALRVAEVNAFIKALQLALAAVITDGDYQKLLKKYALTDYAIDKSGINLGS